jgi:hypothetical protein
MERREAMSMCKKEKKWGFFLRSRTMKPSCNKTTGLNGV